MNVARALYHCAMTQSSQVNNTKKLRLETDTGREEKKYCTAENNIEDSPEPKTINSLASLHFNLTYLTISQQLFSMSVHSTNYGYHYLECAQRGIPSSRGGILF